MVPFLFLAVESVFFKVCTCTCFSLYFCTHLNFCFVQIITRSKSYFNTFKVPFEEVPDLVASRRVFLSKGYAYVAMSQVCTEYDNKNSSYCFDWCSLWTYLYDFLGGFISGYSIPVQYLKGTCFNKQVNYTLILLCSVIM